MLIVQDLNYSYDHQQILQQINLSLEAGKIYTLIGRSGVGKTTLLKLMSGIYQPKEGVISIKGDRLDPRQHNLAYVPQHYGLIPWYSVKKNILLPRKLRNRKKDVKKERLMSLSKELRIDHIMDKFPVHISGGQKQRVAIGRALFQRPDILLMDEPFSSLDQMHRNEARDVFLRVWKKHCLTTVIVTHDLLEAIYLGHHIMILKESSTLEICDNPYYHKALEKGLEDIYAYKRTLEDRM